MLKFNRKGQNTLEYVLLITCVVVAFLAIQYYLNQGIQGRARDASDNIGNQFEAGNTLMTFSTERGSTSKEKTEQTDTGMKTTSTLIDRDELSERYGSETVYSPFED